MKNQRFDTDWIWIPHQLKEDDNNPQFVYFRKEFSLGKTWSDNKVKISADSRYKLYVNGVFVQEGPCKGDCETWYYDEADLSNYLTEGDNVLAIKVLRYPEDKAKRNHSIHRGEISGLFINGSIHSDGGEIILSGKNGWKCYKTNHIRLLAENTRPAPLHILEDVTGNEELHGWMYRGYDDTNWLTANPYSIFEVNQTISPGNLTKREIPYQKHTDRRFQKVMCVRSSDRLVETEEIKCQWEDLIVEKNKLMIPANTKETIEISAGELMTAYLLLNLVGGEGTRITLHCAECYSYPEPEEKAVLQVPKKGDREDYVNGRLYGFCDYYLTGGYGTDKLHENYETFWFRTFRFISITVETKEEPIIFKSFQYRETGYPLEVKSHVTTSDETLSSIWDISERTLKRCMHETYMDCPFYEQLQYVMDARSEILFTYTSAADDRLARKCIDDFRRSQRSDGMINCCAPTCRSNVIPGFSIYYILMVHDHMMYFGDKELVSIHFPAIDSILNNFGRHLSVDGLVEGIGGLYMRKPYWSFIDWVKEWDTGTPPAIVKGAITMESLLYIMGLMYAAELARYLNRDCVAEEYESRAEVVRRAVRTCCIGKGGLIQDGPGVSGASVNVPFTPLIGESPEGRPMGTSVHCQVFGVLTGVLSREEGRILLNKTIGYNEYAQCSVAMNFYVFRALEQVGLYEKTNELWEVWRDMVKKNLTTCVENPTDERSDCHAWGALCLYELPAVVLGVKPTKPGFEEVEITPNPGYLSFANGKVITPKGFIEVEWIRQDNGELSISYKAENKMNIFIKDKSKL